MARVDSGTATAATEAGTRVERSCVGLTAKCGAGAGFVNHGRVLSDAATTASGIVMAAKYGWHREKVGGYLLWTWSATGGTWPYGQLG